MAEPADTQYALPWLLANWGVHRYETSSTSELFVILSIIMLDNVGYRPTPGEIAKITRLPKSSICRYVAKQMDEGYIKEIIDPRDRRRRLLHPTSRAKNELKWCEREFGEFLNLLESIDWNIERSRRTEAGLDLIEVLSQATTQDA